MKNVFENLLFTWFIVALLILNIFYMTTEAMMFVDIRRDPNVMQVKQT